MNQTTILLFFLMVVVATTASSDLPEDLLEADTENHNSHREVRGYPDYDSWKPQSSTPDVILIKQKEPDDHHHGHHHHGHDEKSSLSSVLKDNLPLFAVLAPLAAAAVLFPLKAYFAANYVLYPPVTAAPTAAAAKKRVGKEHSDVTETQTMAGQVLNMIDELDKIYGETASKQKRK